MNYEAMCSAKDVLYALGELLAVEAESVKEVLYEREKSDSLFVVLENGKKFKITVAEEKE